MEETIRGKKLNRGEWAEFYTMLKLLGDGILYTANEQLQKNLNCYLNVIKIVRQENDEILEYVINKQNNTVEITTKVSETPIAIFPTDDFKNTAAALFDGIKNQKGISVPAPDYVCDFARNILVTKPKAPGVKALNKQFGGKNDIIIEVEDSHTSIKSIMGFSIKSLFGQNPTLFNAGSSSQFVFRLSNCNDELMKEFNEIHDRKGRGWTECRKFLFDNDITLEFVKTKNQIYENNMFLIRESMSKIMAWCVKDRLINSDKDYGVMETVSRMIDQNPLNVYNPEIFYEKVIKDFLIAGFTGMTAGKSWDGKEQVNGGYIVVMEDGDVICYHSNDREAFRNYLYKNTRFEYVSADKYAWSKIYRFENQYYIPLNVSIRFNKHIR